MRIQVGLWTSVFCAALAAPAGAQSYRPGGSSGVVSSQARAEAKRLFSQAHLAYKNGDYEDAILKWQQSYELSKEPLIYESIANAYERLGDTKHAVENLKEWRKVAPFREHQTLDSRISRLEARLATEEAEAAKREAERRELAEKEEARARELELKRRAEEEAARGPSAKAILNYSLIGGGGLLVATGIVLDVVAASKRSELGDACRATVNGQFCLSSERSAIATSNTMAIAGDIAWIAGGVAATAGVAMLVMAPDKSPAAPVEDVALNIAVRPIPLPTGGGVWLTGSF